MNDQSSLLALEPGYELHWYRIERVLGQGAFGITYLAKDINLDREVAIKEYLPGQFSVRNTDLTVRPSTNELRGDFEWGLKRFISEARTLTKFEHNNLVRVFNVFEMNNTAYMVMNYELGKSLQQILKSRKTLNESEIKKILSPLMDGVELMHTKGFVHRDIKPGNIFIRGDGSPVLLDFGSARQTRSSQTRDGSEETTTMTTLVSPGYAPIEQYGSKSDRQGPWTDIYGLGATLYRAVTGLTPVAAVDRGEAIVHDIKDPYLSIKEAFADRYSTGFLAAIDHALAFKSQDRPQSIAAWRTEFNFNDNEIRTIIEPDTQIDSSDAATIRLDESEQETLNLSEAETEKPEQIDTEAETLPLLPDKKPTVFFSHRNILLAGTATVVILIGAMVFMGEDEEPSVAEIPAPEIQTQTSVQAPEEIALTEESTQETLSDIPEPDIDELNQAHIKELLTRAQEDIKALRLTSPKDNNAFDKYLSVLQLDELNEDAKIGIQAISDKYVALAYSAMDANKLDNAESYLKKASAITPNSEKITAAQETLQSKRTAPTITAEPAREPTETQQTASTDPEEPNESFWNKAKKWHKDNMEKSKKIDKDKTIDNRVKKVLGGQ